jgi:probable F420-dependent oxidoreductase
VELGTYGIWTTYRRIDEDRAGEAAKLVEQLGFGTFWLGGSPQLAQLRPLLEATERIAVATGIVNVWANDPADVAREYAALEADFPGRFLLGIGIGHPEATSDYTRPLTAMRRFLDELDPAVPANRRVLAALAPKMLALSAERSLGAIPYFAPPAHTAAARAAIGPDKLLAPEIAVTVDEDDARGRATSREYASLYLGLTNYTSNLLRHGYAEQDIADGGSDRLIDELVPHGSAAHVATEIRRHLDAGADHVVVQTLGEQGVPERGWRAVAAELID